MYLFELVADDLCGTVTRSRVRSAGASVQLVTCGATGHEDSVIYAHTNDVEAAYEEAQELGYETVKPITTQPWGVHRFCVRHQTATSSTS